MLLISTALLECLHREVDFDSEKADNQEHGVLGSLQTGSMELGSLQTGSTDRFTSKSLQRRIHLCKGGRCPSCTLHQCLGLCTAERPR